ncbi:MAG: hypothetical protein GF317_02410 [Candidatus Lokiarchaeota archaeon]|nr:hypothetical protein [Candidatus Lokiarchaeota archaeon]MBD3198759.1 hypothetical protein [Candidatus Lokiarchaeota archaeon]
MKEESKKSHAFGVRLNNKQYENLLDFSHEFHLKKSQVLKKAFDEWIALKKSFMDENIILISKALFQEILAIISDDEIIRIGQMMANNFISRLHFKFMNNEGGIKMLDFLDRALINLGPEGHAWFNDISFKFLDNREIVIFGSHSINKNFSKYIKTVLHPIMKELFKYKLIDSHISNNTIELKFIPIQD